MSGGFGWNYPMFGGDPWRSPWAEPRSRAIRIRQPATLPISLEEAVLHLRLDPAATTGPEAPLITSMIEAATRHLRDYAGVALMHEDWRMTLRHWPLYSQGLTLRPPPFAELLRIRVNQVAQPLADFLVEEEEYLPAKLFAVNRQWPGANWAEPDAVIIEWRAGREKPEEVSAALRQAILMAVAFWYEQRESSAQFPMHPVIELGWRSLLSAYREVGFA